MDGFVGVWGWEGAVCVCGDEGGGRSGRGGGESEGWGEHGEEDEEGFWEMHS